MRPLTLTQNTLLLRFVRLMIRMDRLPAARWLLGKGVYDEPLRLPIARPISYLVNHPEHIRHILVTNARNYRKLRGGRFLGQGLLTSEHALHAQQRGAMQPSFHRSRVVTTAGLVVDATTERLATWREGRTLDASAEMARIALTALGKVFLSTDLTASADEIVSALAVCQQHMQRLVRVPEHVATPLNRRYGRALERLDALVHRLIVERRASADKPDDLLSALVTARLADGSAMSDEQIRDEIVTVLFAGHDTVANALGWAWYLLARHPEVESRVADEVLTHVGTRRIVADDAQALAYTRSVFLETLRLYPPAWIFTRFAIDSDVLGSGVPIPSGAQIFISPYVAHRNPAYFPRPDVFDPDRFQDGRRSALPAFAFFPFSGGSRNCIGESFATLEALCIMATVVQRFRLCRLTPRRVPPLPLVTLSPRGGIAMQVRARAAR
jgi:cytochrome P450